VIANRGTLEAPRWVRTEVETFRKHHPGRPIIPINIGGAMQDAALTEAVRPWLDVHDQIWLDDTEEAIARGVATAAVVDRLSLSPRQLRTAQWWRVTVAGVTLSLLGLAASTGWSAYLAHQNASRAEAEAQRARAAEEHARAELRNSVGLRLRAEAAAMFAGLRPEPDERAMQQLLAALRLAGDSRQADAEAEGGLLEALRREKNLVRLIATPTALVGLVVSPGGERLVTADDARRLQLWNARTGARLGEPLEAHPEDIRSLAISPDGRRLVTGSDDTTLRLWAVTDGGIQPDLAFPSPATPTPCGPSPSAPTDGWPPRAATTTPPRSGTWPPASPSARPWSATRKRSPASPSAPTGACSPPPATTAACACGGCATANPSARRCWATKTPCAASPSAPTARASSPAPGTGT
jgi:hypothetical protein